MIYFEVDLIPISRMAEDGGPTKMTPLLVQASANSVFSERKPYPREGERGGRERREKGEGGVREERGGGERGRREGD